MDRRETRNSKFDILFQQFENSNLRAHLEREREREERARKFFNRNEKYYLYCSFTVQYTFYSTLF